MDLAPKIFSADSGRDPANPPVVQTLYRLLQFERQFLMLTFIQQMKPFRNIECLCFE